MLTYVYVDGTGLYLSALKGTPYKWLDIKALCERLLPHNNIVQIRYFAERLPVPDAAQRQETYLRALASFEEISVHVVKRRRLQAEMAAFLVVDAPVHHYECAVLVTNDAEFAVPIELVRSELRRPVGVISPAPHFSRPLYDAATFPRKIRKGVLAASQLADPMIVGDHEIHKPPEW